MGAGGGHCCRLQHEPHYAACMQHATCNMQRTACSIPATCSTQLCSMSADMHHKYAHAMRMRFPERRRVCAARLHCHAAHCVPHAIRHIACALPERRRVCGVRMCALEQSERAHQRLLPLALRKRTIPYALDFLKHIARPAPASADAVLYRRRCAGRCAQEASRPPAQPIGRSARPMRSCVGCAWH